MESKRMRLEIITILYITTLTSGAHNPKVHEDVIDHTPASSFVQYQQQLHQYQKQHQDQQHKQQQEKSKIAYSQPPFTYQKTTHQMDPLKSRYAQQQQVDFTALHQNARDRKMSMADLLRIESFLAQNRGKLMFIPFDEPLALKQDSSLSEKVDNDPKLLTTKSKRTNPPKVEYTKNSNQPNTKELLDRKDIVAPNNQRYIYIQPSILKNSFGLDSKVAKQILQRAAPKRAMQNHQDHYQISALQDLIGKNPNVQLEGLTRLLNQDGHTVAHPTSYSSGPIIKNPKPFQPHVKPTYRDHQEDKVSAATSTHQDVVPIPNLNIGPNRSLEDIQRELDAVSKAQADSALAQAHKYAMAQVEAQHKAIALAQAKAHEDALARISAQGLHTQYASNNQVQRGSNAQHQALALVQQQHQTLVQAQPQQHYDDNHIPQMQESPSSYSNVHTNIPNVAPDYIKYAPNNVYYAAPEGHVAAEYSQAHGGEAQQDISSNSGQQIEYVEQTANNDVVGKNEDDTHQTLSLNLNKNENNGFGHSTPQPESFHQIILESNHQSQNVKQIFMKKEKPKSEHSSNDDLQYASKYAFGYRILDVKEGSDFGHEEKRNGKSAKGHYHVLLPDGRLQKVDYYADDDGYHAKVTYENEAKH